MNFSFFKNKLYSFLAIDFIVLFIVILLFKNLDSKIAGIIAASIFLAQGFYILFTIIKWPNYYDFTSLYGSLIHIFIATIPVLMVRLAFWSKNFEDIALGTITAKHLHMFAEVCYCILIITHIIDLIKINKKIKLAA